MGARGRSDDEALLKSLPTRQCAAPRDTRPGDPHPMEMPTMKTRSLAIGCLAALAVASLAAPASGEDLLQIYREGLVSDPTLAAARATWVATQEALPQARSGLLPVVSLLGNANEQNYYNRLHTNPGVAVTQQFPSTGTRSRQASRCTGPRTGLRSTRRRCRSIRRITRWRRPSRT
jgi:hypothetical protein